MSIIFTNIDAPFSLIVEHVTQAEFESAGLTDWLTDEEQSHYDELRCRAVAKRGQQWLLGRYAAKLACHRWQKQQGIIVSEWNDIQVSNVPSGMPMLALKGSNKSPVLSIAHTGEEAVAAVAASDNSIGVDIENRVITSNLNALAKRVCSGIEYRRWFSDLKESEWPERFRQLWLAKEAAAKCTKEGLQWKPGQFEVMKVDELTANVCHEGIGYTVFFEKTGVSLVAIAWPGR